MKVVALLSGGKDSVYSIIECMRYGHEIICLANLYPADSGLIEMDSFMYQTIGHDMIEIQAKCLDLPLVRQATNGKSINVGMEYQRTANDEVEDLFLLLSTVKAKFPEIEGVCSGAILSNYQRHRVENVCERIGIHSIAYLWQRDQRELLAEMVDFGIEAVVLKIASFGLKTSMLGKTIQELKKTFLELDEKFGFHCCGEGGEYETLTLNCPIFKSRIVIDESSVILDSSCQDVAHLSISKFHLEPNAQFSKIPVQLDHFAVSPVNSSSFSPILNNSLFNFVSSDFVSSEGGLIYSKLFYIDNEDSGLSMSQETEALLKLVQKLLVDNSLSFKNVVFVNLFISDMSLFSDMNKVYSEYIPKIWPPSRSCVETALKRCQIALTLVLCDEATLQDKRSVLHVKSYSRWAPLCIGPYSQANTVGELTFIAGQIPLDPGTMTVVQGSVLQQAQLCFKHVSSVMMCLQANRIVSTIIYLAVKVAGDRDLKHQVEQVREMLRSENQSSPLVFCIVSKLPRDVCVEAEVIVSKVQISAANVFKTFQELKNAALCFKIFKVFYSESKIGEEISSLIKTHFESSMIIPLPVVSFTDKSCSYLILAIE